VDVIENLKLNKYFDFVIASSLVGYEKPNKMIYEHALRMAGDIKAKDALHVGDDVDKYVKDY
jgi:HAD superfamily hydrolase (TIGR01549 family)